MEPQIQYCKTSDGVSIAYTSTGQGPPFIWMELPSALQSERKLLPGKQRTYETLEHAATLVRYDHRGFGRSERAISSFPIDALVADLEAVVDKLGLTRFILFGSGGLTAPIAIAYAAAHPESVSYLVLVGALARIPPQLHQQMQALMHSGSDWRFVSESMVRLTKGWDDEEASRAIAAWYRDAGTFDTFRAFWRDVGEWDVRDRLPSVVTPTLLLNPTLDPLSRPDEIREIASSLPDARTGIVDGATFAERSPQYQVAIASFLLGPEDAQTWPVAASPMLPSSTAVILFADIADSTALTERLGDAAFRDKARDLDDALRRAITSNGGTAIDGKLLGDGVLATFGAAREAISAALACEHAASASELGLHIGLHAGDVIRERAPDGRDNVYGGAVNIAARICTLAAPGEVLVSRTVADLARTSAGVSFEDRGDQELKGIDGPVRLYEVRWREET